MSLRNSSRGATGVQWALIGVGALLLVALLIGCGAPPPSIPATPIPTLIPATLPPMPTLTPQPLTVGVAFPSRRPSVEAASKLYQQHCSTCHGPQGTGLVPGARDFTDADYLRGQTPLRIYRIITEGRGGMPGWEDKLSVDERWDLTFYIWHLSTPQEMIEEGKGIFEQNCAACHGLDGRGAVPGAPDFTDFAWVILRSPRELFRVLTEGVEGMPSWQGRLTPEQRWAAIEYVRTFACQTPRVSTTASLASP